LAAARIRKRHPSIVPPHWSVFGMSCWTNERFRSLKSFCLLSCPLLVSELVQDDELGAGVASDDQADLAVAFGFLEFVRERRQCGEADASSFVGGADREAGAEMRLPGPRVANEDDGIAVVDPRSFGERGDRLSHAVDRQTGSGQRCAVDVHASCRHSDHPQRLPELMVPSSLGARAPGRPRVRAAQVVANRFAKPS
jgi:hypothetical protein